MPEESIVFSPTISDRDLDREVSDVDDRLASVGEDVPVNFDAEELDSLSAPGGGVGGGRSGDSLGDMSATQAAMLGIQKQTLTYQKQSAMEDVERNKILTNWGSELEKIRQRIPALSEGSTPELGGGGIGGLGGGRGGGMGGATGAGAAAGLASKIPKPVAGVTASAALPVALSGAVGVGMLSAMHSSSARLQTSATLLGQAWNSVWRPIGDRVDELFIRDTVKEVRDAAVDFEDQFRSGDPVGAAAGFGSELLSGRTGNLANLLFPPSIGLRLANEAARAISSTDWSGVSDSVTSWFDKNAPSLPSWSDLKPDLPAWSDLAPDLPTWGSLTPDLPSWGDLTPSLPNWSSLTPSLPDWSDINPFGGSGGDPPRPTPGATSPTAGFDGYPEWIDESEVEGGASGGRVGRSGVAQIHRGEILAQPDRLVDELASAINDAGGGGGGDTSAVEQKLDRLHRDLRALHSAMDVTIEVDGEQIGRVSQDARRNRIGDTNPRV